MSRLKFRNDFESDDDLDFDQINREASGRDSVGENIYEEIKHYKAVKCCAGWRETEAREEGQGVRPPAGPAGGPGGRPGPRPRPPQQGRREGLNPNS